MSDIKDIERMLEIFAKALGGLSTDIDVMRAENDAYQSVFQRYIARKSPELVKEYQDHMEKVIIQKSEEYAKNSSISQALSQDELDEFLKRFPKNPPNPSRN